MLNFHFLMTNLRREAKGEKQMDYLKDTSDVIVKMRIKQDEMNM